MARCGSEVPFTKASLPSRLRSLDNEWSQMGHESVYGDKEVVVRVVNISRRFLSPVANCPLPYRGYVSNGILCLNFVAVMDFYGNVFQFLLNPSLNPALDGCKFICGSVILLQRYAARKFTGIRPFHEICKYEIVHVNPSTKTLARWVFDSETTDEIVKKIASIHCPIVGAVPQRIWLDSVPLWPLHHPPFPETPDVVTNADSLKRICDRVNIEGIHQDWTKVPPPFPNLVVRIRARGNPEFYRQPSLRSELPMKINLAVYDSTGACAVVIWDHSLSAEQSNKLREGQVIVLRNYEVKRNVWDYKFQINFEGIRKFPIELHVQDDRMHHKKSAEIVSKVHSDLCPKQLPTIRQTCNTITHLRDKWNTKLGRNLLPEDTFTVAGVLVGLSRYYRVRREVDDSWKQPIGRFYVFRWLEIYDPKSECSLSIETFINKQVDHYADLEIGDIVVLTFVRLCQRKASHVKEDLTYVTTTQHTELLVVKNGVGDEEIPKPLDDELREIMSLMEDGNEIVSSCWMGGAHQFTNTFYCNWAIRNLYPKSESSYEALPSVLRELAFWESKMVWFPGKIVQVDYCRPQPTPWKLLSGKSGKILAESTVIAKAETWDSMRQDVPLFGSDLPYCLTFPVRYMEGKRATLHEWLQFPRTNVYEEQLQLERTESEESTSETDFFEVLTNGYYRLIILHNDNKIAVSSFFIPIVSEKCPSLAQALHLSHDPLRKPFESPIMKNMSYSNDEVYVCKETAPLLLNKEIDAFLQVRNMGDTEREVLFGLLQFRNSDDEVLYRFAEHTFS